MDFMDLKERFKQIDFRRGAGTYITFTVCLIATMMLMSYLIVSSRVTLGQTGVNTALNYVAREIVIEDSLENAQRKARRLAREYLQGPIYQRRSISVSVRYAMGADEWRKGNFLEVIISAKDKNGMANFNNSTLVMIE